MGTEKIITIMISIFLITGISTLFIIKLNQIDGVMKFTDYNKNSKIFILLGLLIDSIVAGIFFILVVEYENFIACELKIKEFIQLFSIITLSGFIALFILLLDIAIKNK